MILTCFYKSNALPILQHQHQSTEGRKLAMLTSTREYHSLVLCYSDLQTDSWEKEALSSHCALCVETQVKTTTKILPAPKNFICVKDWQFIRYQPYI